jgi:transcriptional regulator
MYIPYPFEEKNEHLVRQFLKDWPFGTLTGVVDGRLWSVHLPFTIPDEGPLRLQAHLARANDIAGVLTLGELLVQFLGPHSYVSPSWYTHDKQYPTWIYAAVHVYGHARLLGPEELDTQVRQLIRERESAAGVSPAWQLDAMPPAVTDHLSSMIVGFELDIVSLKPCFKLNQHKRPEDVEAMAAQLRMRGSASQELAALALQALNRVDPQALARYVDKYKIPGAAAS